MIMRNENVIEIPTWTVVFVERTRKKKAQMKESEHVVLEGVTLHQ